MNTTSNYSELTPCCTVLLIKVVALVDLDRVIDSLRRATCVVRYLSPSAFVVAFRRSYRITIASGYVRDVSSLIPHSNSYFSFEVNNKKIFNISTYVGPCNEIPTPIARGN